MDLNKIRSMNDAELKSYLKSLSDRKNLSCYKCGKENANYTINIQNRKQAQQKKLCSLCDKCYGELLEYLSTPDIMWD